MDSKEVAVAALRLVVTEGMEEETLLRKNLEELGFKTAAVNFGGEFITSVGKMIERTVVIGKREGIIGTSRIEEGALAGAAREAISQIMGKAIGLNVGGKIAVTRFGAHVSVAMFFGIGLLNMNEVAVGLGHRMI